MGGGGWKRIALDSNKERFMEIKGFLHIKRRLLRTVKSRSNERCFGCENERLLREKRKAFCKRKLFGLQKRVGLQFMQSYPIKKSIFQRTTTPTSHCTKTNVQQPFSNTACYCELAVKQLFFEKHRSCVCTTVTLSHRFKAFSPPFCGQNRFRLVSPEISAKSLPAEL